MAREYEYHAMTIAELLRGFVADSLIAATSVSSRRVSGLALDSRDIGVGFAFIALQGETGHGMDYCQAAIDNGAAVLLYDGKVSKNVVNLAQVKASVPAIKIDDLASKLAQITQRMYPQSGLALDIIGITGTNGKTTCSQYIASALSRSQATAVMGTLGNGFMGSLQDTRHTTPDNVAVHRLLNEFYNEGAENVVMEVSSHGLDQGRVDNVPFKVAMFTNLTQDHLDYHVSMEAYGAAKRKLFDLFQPEIAVINIDDPFGEKLLQALPQESTAVSYSTNTNKIGANYVCAGAKYICASVITQNNNGMQISFDSSWGKAKFNSPLMGLFNASNLLGVLAVLLALDMPLAEAVVHVETFVALPGRMQTVTSVRQPQSHPLVVVDYAHTPDALENVLQSLRQHLLPSSKNLIQSSNKLFCVFGCGGDRDAGKRAIMGRIAQRHADHVVLTDDNPRTESAVKIVKDIIAGFTDSSAYTVIHDRDDAIRHVIKQANASDIVVIAGKGHENYQIIGSQKNAYPSDITIAEVILGISQDGNGDRGDHA